MARKKRTAAATPTPATEARTYLVADCKRYTAAFGAENGIAWLLAGKTWEQALELHIEALAAHHDAERRELLAALDSAQREAVALRETIDAMRPKPKPTGPRWTDASGRRVTPAGHTAVADDAASRSPVRH